MGSLRPSGGFLSTIYFPTFYITHRRHGLLRNFLPNGAVFGGKSAVPNRIKGESERAIVGEFYRLSGGILNAVEGAEIQPFPTVGATCAFVRNPPRISPHIRPYEALYA